VLLDVSEIALQIWYTSNSAEPPILSELQSLHV